MVAHAGIPCRLLIHPLNFCSIIFCLPFLFSLPFVLSLTTVYLLHLENKPLLPLFYIFLINLFFIYSVLCRTHNDGQHYGERKAGRVWVIRQLYAQAAARLPRVATTL